MLHTDKRFVDGSPDLTWQSILVVDEVKGRLENAALYSSSVVLGLLPPPSATREFHSLCAHPGWYNNYADKFPQTGACRRCLREIWRGTFTTTKLSLWRLVVRCICSTACPKVALGMIGWAGLPRAGQDFGSIFET